MPDSVLDPTEFSKKVVCKVVKVTNWFVLNSAEDGLELCVSPLIAVTGECVLKSVTKLELWNVISELNGKAVVVESVWLRVDP